MTKRKKQTGSQMKRSEPSDRVGIAWFDETQYRRLLEVAANRGKLYDTHEAWRLAAEATVTRMPFAPVRVPIQVDEVLAWCREREVPLDGAARSQNVAEWVQHALPTGDHGPKS